MSHYRGLIKAHCAFGVSYEEARSMVQDVLDCYNFDNRPAFHQYEVPYKSEYFKYFLEKNNFSTLDQAKLFFEINPTIIKKDENGYDEEDWSDALERIFPQNLIESFTDDFYYNTDTSDDMELTDIRLIFGEDSMTISYTYYVSTGIWDYADFIEAGDPEYDGDEFKCCEDFINYNIELIEKWEEDPSEFYIDNILETNCIIIGAENPETVGLDPSSYSEIKNFFKKDVSDVVYFFSIDYHI